MKITIVTPPSEGVATGNRCTARDWARVLEDLGNVVAVREAWDESDDSALLVALHSTKSSASVQRFRRANPGGRVVVVLTGTDLYGEMTDVVLASMEAADRLVVLQRKAMETVPARFHDKTRIIVQSSRKSDEGAAMARSRDPFDVCVAGHLRKVKDPLRAAAASRRLPEASKIRIRQAGAILEPEYEESVRREEQENPRYAWLGELPTDQLKSLMARCQLTVVSSELEGGARVAGESIIEGTPVLGSRIDGLIGLLGESYPGFFGVGDTAALADLLWRAESDAAFLGELRAASEGVAGQFDPDREKETWKNLLAELRRDLRTTGIAD